MVHRLIDSEIQKSEFYSAQCSSLHLQGLCSQNDVKQNEINHVQYSSHYNNIPVKLLCTIKNFNPQNGHWSYIGDHKKQNS